MIIEKLTLGMISNNTYIIYNENETDCIIIDPAYEYQPIKNFLDENKLVVRYILLTHGHFDHIGTLFELKRDYNSVIYVHEADNELMVERSFKRLTDMTHKPLHVIKPDVFVKDGDTLNLLGLNFIVFHTPGHTKGCVCYILEDIMFTGDTLFNGTIGRTDLPDSNHDEMIESLKKINALEKNYTVFCGHGEDTTLFREKRTNPYLLEINNG